MGVSVLLRLFISSNKYATLLTSSSVYISENIKIKLITIRKGQRKFRECQYHRPKPIPDTRKGKRKQTKPNKRKSNKCTKSTSSLFPKRDNRNAKRTQKYNNKITQGKTEKKSPRRINHKVKKSNTNFRTTALERSVE